MKLPKTISIYGKTYKVIEADSISFNNSHHYEGLILYEKSIIYINKKIPTKQGKEQTLLHECVHGIIRRLSGGQWHLSQEVEETICEGVATWLTETFNLSIKAKKK